MQRGRNVFAEPCITQQLCRPPSGNRLPTASPEKPHQGRLGGRECASRLPSPLAILAAWRETIPLPGAAGDSRRYSPVTGAARWSTAPSVDLPGASSARGSATRLVAPTSAPPARGAPDRTRRKIALRGRALRRLTPFAFYAFSAAKIPSAKPPSPRDLSYEQCLRQHVEQTGRPLPGWDRKDTLRPTTFMMTTTFVGLQIVRIGRIYRLAQPLRSDQAAYLRALGLTLDDLLPVTTGPP